MKTKTERFLDSMKNGNNYTVNQAISRFGFASKAAVQKAVSTLRQEGYAIYLNDGHNVSSYRLGTPTRAVVSAGYAALR